MLHYIKIILPFFFIVLFRKFRDNLKLIFSVKNQNWGINFNNKDCVVLANGPSLDYDIENHESLLSGKVKICVNYFPLKKNFFILKPEVFLIFDPYFFLDNTDFKINKINDTFNIKTHDLIKKLTKVNWELIIFIPYKNKNSFFVEKIKNNKFLSLKFVKTNTCGYMNDKEIFKYYKSNIYTPPFYNVIVACTYILLNIGFKELYIIGFNYNGIQDIYLDKNNKVCRVHDYLTNNKEHLTRDNISMTDIFEEHYKTYLGLKSIRMYSDHLNAKIFNGSKDTLIDVFERI